MERCLRSAMANTVVMMCLVASIAGCAHAESREVSAAAQTASETATQGIPLDIRSSNSVEALLSYGVLLRSIQTEPLEREYALAAHTLANDPNAPNRIRLALLHSLAGTSFQDNTRAKEYLEQVLDDSGDNVRQYHDLARFLVAMLNDRKQVESELAEERRQRRELQQKLDQLKAIEQDTGTRIPPMKEN